MMVIANPIFRMGDHVRLSELGASRLKKAHSGRIVGAGKASKLTIRVLL
jgi:tRNA pseudouridine-54 N-methylase